MVDSKIIVVVVTKEDVAWADVDVVIWVVQIVVVMVALHAAVMVDIIMAISVVVLVVPPVEAVTVALQGVVMAMDQLHEVVIITVSFEKKMDHIFY